MADKKTGGGRFSLALNPKTLWAIKRLAEYEGISANLFISNVLDAIAEKHGDVLKEVWLADEKAKREIKFVSTDADAIDNSAQVDSGDADK